MSKKRPTSRRITQKGVPEGPARGAPQQQQQQQQQPDHTALLQHGVLHGGVRKGAPLTERLKHSILARREAQGLMPLSPEKGEQRVKHELTPEEIEKKERRKEQNRRAARKCRLKKKLLQTDAAKDYESIAIQNVELEREIEKLRAEQENLKRELSEHLMSGQCRNIKVEKEEMMEVLYEVPQALPAQTLSPQILTAPTPSPQILSPHAHAPQVLLPHALVPQILSVQGLALQVVPPPVLQSQTFPSQDLINLYLDEPLNPLDTFDDFLDLNAIASDGAGDAEATSAPPIPGCMSAAALATRACPSGVAGRSRENLELEALGAGQRCNTVCRGHQTPSPWSPAPTRDLQHERHPSTSSVTSDCSEASQGFQLVPTRGLLMAASPEHRWPLGLGLEGSAKDRTDRGFDINLNLLPPLGPESSELEWCHGFGWQETAEEQTSEDFHGLDVPRHWPVSYGQVDDEEVFDEEDLS